MFNSCRSGPAISMQGVYITGHENCIEFQKVGESWPADVRGILMNGLPIYGRSYLPSSSSTRLSIKVKGSWVEVFQMRVYIIAGLFLIVGLLLIVGILPH